ncbi:MAG: metallophosphoesterase [Candidatus Aminicenantes bacterium]|nr:metallophosphoesterase [Candidatus Aminicenantes bacterium]
MIGIISDSHDNLNAVRLAVQLFRDRNCDLVLHAGDVVAPFTAQELRGCGCLVRAVFGNCDGEKEGLRKAFDGWGAIEEPPVRLQHGGLSITLTHRDARLDRLLRRSSGGVVVFGHTHRPLFERRKTALLVNPGEAGGWLRGKSTVALLDPATLAVEIITLS